MSSKPRERVRPWNKCIGVAFCAITGSKIDKTSHKLSILGWILKFIPFFWCELQYMLHWSRKSILLSNAKLVQQFFNILLMGYEYVPWILNHFNAWIVVKMSQICHPKAFLQLFLYGCNVAFIVHCYQHIIYILQYIQQIFHISWKTKLDRQDLNAWNSTLEDAQLTFHTMILVLVSGHIRILWVYILFVLVPSQQNLLVETWIYFPSSLHSRK